MMLENTDVVDDTIEISCYICGLDLMQQCKDDETIQQKDLNQAKQQFPTMTGHDGIKKYLCGPCYKNHRSRMEVYKKANPKLEYPKARE